MDRVLCKSLLCLCALLPVVSSGNATPQNPTVLESSDTEFRFQIAVAPDLSDLFSDVNDDSSVSLYKPVVLAVPLGATAELVSANGLQPVSLESPISGLSQSALVRLSPPTLVRGRQLVTAVVCPVNGGVIYTTIDIHVRFVGGRSTGTRPVDDLVFDRILGATVANYAQARNWAIPARSFAKPAQDPFSDLSTWYKLTTSQSGLYKVTGSQLQAAGLSLTGLASSDLRLFDGGGLQLEVDTDLPRPEFREIAIMVDDGGDGQFGYDDYILFYGESVDRWLYSADADPQHVHHHYTDRNAYWLAADNAVGQGLRWAELDASSDGNEDTVITTYTRRVHSERDSLFSLDQAGRLRDYYNWFWIDQTNPELFVPTGNIVPGSTVEIDMAYEAPSGVSVVDLSVNGAPAQRLDCGSTSCLFSSTGFVDGLNQLELDFWGTGDIPPYLDWVDVHYESYLIPAADKLEITLDTADALVLVEVVDEFGSDPLLLSLSDPGRPTVLSGYVRAGGDLTFAAQLVASAPNRYYLTTPERASSPSGVEKVAVKGLRAATNQTDYIIIAPEAFKVAVEDYATYRSDAGLSVSVVTVEDIYDEFAYGLNDPTAIRDFLSYAYDNYPSPPPSMVLFVGDGDYDYLGLTHFESPEFVPPYIHGLDDSYGYGDDNYVYFGDYGYLDSDSSATIVPDRGVDMVAARWPVRSTGEIAAIVAKVQQYESSTDFGPWRTNITLVADDENTLEGSWEIVHTEQTDSLDRGHIPRMFNRDKIYGIEYPFVGRRKPSMNDAVVDAFNAGSIIVNYVGHGNPVAWAHEYVFTTSDDIPRLNNFDRLPLIVTASCAIGFFDDPERQAMAEDLLTCPDGGGIGVISATRLVWSSPNAALNKQLFNMLFAYPELSMGEALCAAKLLHQQIYGVSARLVRNDRAYILLGDPLAKLAQPRLGIEFDSAPDSLVALEPVTVSGHVVDGVRSPRFADGTLHISVYDSDKLKNYVYGESGGEPLSKDYSVAGATIYRGSSPVRGGAFEFRFVPPLDIGYGGQSARIMVYADLDTIDAAGIVDSILVTDSIAASADTVGPIIEYAFTGVADFTSGDKIGPEDDLQVVLSDPSGINLTGGLGHWITLEIDDQADRVINLTGLFEYDEADYTTGRITWQPDSLTPGQHRFKLKAWDNANNSSTAEFAAEVVAASGVALHELLNHPNPMADSTRFSFYAPGPLESFRLDIYTLSGRRIQSFGPFPIEAGYFDDIVWWGRDFVGDRVATGVYIYRAVCRSVDGGQESEQFGKVVVIN